MILNYRIYTLNKFQQINQKQKHYQFGADVAVWAIWNKERSQNAETTTDWNLVHIVPIVTIVPSAYSDWFQSAL